MASRIDLTFALLVQEQDMHLRPIIFTMQRYHCICISQHSAGTDEDGGLGIDGVPDESDSLG